MYIIIYNIYKEPPHELVNKFAYKFVDKLTRRLVIEPSRKFVKELLATLNGSSS